MAKSTIRNQGEGNAEICLYDELDAFWGIGAKDFNRQLAALGPEINEITLRINSPGGSVWEGMAVLAMLNAHKAKIVTRVEGLAASMASVIAMAGDVIEMPENAFMMIHNPADWAAGDAAELRKTAEVLDQVKAQLVNIYAKRSGRTPEEIAAWMDDETWMDGKTCQERGFCTALLPAVNIAASLPPEQFRKTPSGFLIKNGPPTPPPTPRSPKMLENNTAPKAATLKELRAVCPGADEKFLVAQLDADATVEQATQAWMQALQTANAALQEQVKNPPSGKVPGVTPPKNKAGKKPRAEEIDEDKDDSSEVVNVEYDEMEDVEALDHFEAAVKREMACKAKIGRSVDRRQAVMTIANHNPRLHQRWLAACNSSKMGRRLIDEKYDRMPEPPRRS